MAKRASSFSIRSMSDATNARTAGVISASISGGTIIGLAVVDDIINYVVTENAVRVQISFLPGRPPSVAGRRPLSAGCRTSPVVDRRRGPSGTPSLAVSRSSWDADDPLPAAGHASSTPRGRPPRLPVIEHFPPGA